MAPALAVRARSKSICGRAHQNTSEQNAWEQVRGAKASRSKVQWVVARTSSVVRQPLLEEASARGPAAARMMIPVIARRSWAVLGISDAARPHPATSG